MNKLIGQEKVKKLDKCSDKQFISSIVIRVNTEQSIKLALDSTQTNKCIHENKYQMPNIELLLDGVAQAVKTPREEEMFFSAIDSRYAYAQLALQKTRDKRAKDKRATQLQFNRSKSNRQVPNSNKIYGLTDMPFEFAFLSDTLVLTKGERQTTK